MHIPSDKPGEKQQKSRVVLDAAAGALSGAISRFMVGPLDVVKIRFQVQLEPISWHSGKRPSHYHGFVHAFRTIVAEEGIKGLWMGTVPGMLLTIPYTAVQFVALQQCKQAAAKLGWDGKRSAVVSFASGAVAGAAATVASYPFDLLRTTLAAQGEPKVYRGMLDAGRSICQQQGFGGLYRGLGVTLIEIIPYAALQFGLYDVFKQLWDAAALAAARQRTRQLQQEQRVQHARLPGAAAAACISNLNKNSSSSSSSSSDSSGSSGGSSGSSGGGGGGGPLDSARLQAFTCGLAAGLVAKLASHPLDVAKKRYQVAGLARSLRYGARVQRDLAATPLLACLGHIARAEGVRGLWKGSVPSIVKAAPAAAITFTAYETLVALLLSWQADHAAANGGGSRGGSGVTAPDAAKRR